MRRSLLMVLLVVVTAPLPAQDVLTIGTGTAPSGGAVAIPVSIRDRSGTPLGGPGAANRLQAFAFKVTFPASQVASVTFARAGVTAALAPMYENALQGSGFFSYIVSFPEGSNAIPFTPDAAAPGNQVGTLTVTLGNVAAGTVVPLRIDPPSAWLSNQSSSVAENVANGNLALVHGSVTVAGSAATPTNLVATATSPGSISVTWNTAAGAVQYEVWRRFNGGAFALRTTTNATSFTDTSVVASTTYLYEVRALDSGGFPSAFSNIDAATTMLFADDPLVAQTTMVKLTHVQELRTAVNAFRTTAGLAALAADPTLGLGQAVRAQHLTALRAGLNEARTAAGMAALTFTDGTLTGTLVKTTHVHELRGGVK